MSVTVDLDLARKVLEVVDCGLVSGIGEAQPGKMCVEAAVCYAMGLPHSDRPTCVADDVRYAKIYLNDLNCWHDNADRAQALRKLSVAQLGSASIDGEEYNNQLKQHLTRMVLPDLLRSCAQIFSRDKHKKILENQAVACASASSDWRQVVELAHERVIFCSGLAYEMRILFKDLLGNGIPVVQRAANFTHVKNYILRENILHRDILRQFALLGCDAVLEALRDCNSPGVAMLKELGLE